MMELGIVALIGCLLGWLVTITSGSLFAYIVFRTKREPHESMFSLKAPKGDAFIVDPFNDPLPSRVRMPADTPVEDAASKLLDAQTNKFLEQMAMAKAITGSTKDGEK